MVNYTHFSGTYASKESNLSTSPLWRPLFRIEGEKWEFEGGFAALKLPLSSDLHALYGLLREETEI
jgi:hypothetical protein